MKINYKPRTARCKQRDLDNSVEVGQSMTPKEMLIAFTRGLELPNKVSTSYDDNITIDEVGYICSDRLEAVDYLNSVNQRLALAKQNAKKNEVVTATVENNTEVSE